MRRVVLLCGPPGAGKSTAAAESGLPVFDRDHPQWATETQFRHALAGIGERRGAQAVVIRAGATSTARAKTAQLIGATHVFMLIAPLVELERRIRDRHRVDMVATLVASRSWLKRYDRDDQVPDFPGWPALDDELTATGVTSSDW